MKGSCFTVWRVTWPAQASNPETNVIVLNEFETLFLHSEKKNVDQALREFDKGRKPVCLSKFIAMK